METGVVYHWSLKHQLAMDTFFDILFADANSFRLFLLLAVTVLVALGIIGRAVYLIIKRKDVDHTGPEETDFIEPELEAA